jgi:hypothetical protein
VSVTSNCRHPAPYSPQELYCIKGWMPKLPVRNSPEDPDFSMRFQAYVCKTFFESKKRS